MTPRRRLRRRSPTARQATPRPTHRVELPSLIRRHERAAAELRAVSADLHPKGRSRASGHSPQQPAHLHQQPTGTPTGHGERPEEPKRPAPPAGRRAHRTERRRRGRRPAVPSGHLVRSTSTATALTAALTALSEPGRTLAEPVFRPPQHRLRPGELRCPYGHPGEDHQPPRAGKREHDNPANNNEQSHDEDPDAPAEMHRRRCLNDPWSLRHSWFLITLRTHVRQGTRRREHRGVHWNGPATKRALPHMNDLILHKSVRGVYNGPVGGMSISPTCESPSAH